MTRVDVSTGDLRRVFADEVVASLRRTPSRASLQVFLRCAGVVVVRGDLPPAVVSHHTCGVRAARPICPRDSGAAQSSAHPGRARVRQWREARDAGSARRRAFSVVSAGGHLAIGALFRAAASRITSDGPGWRTCGHLRSGAREAVSDTPGGRDAGAVPRLEYRQFRTEAGTSMLTRIRGALAEGDALLLGSDLVKPETICWSPTTIRSR